MAITLKLNKPQTAAQPFSGEAVELMRAIKVREYSKGGPVTQPGEVFAVLLGMGYKRDDDMDIQSRAREFVGQVRQLLAADKRQVPGYDEVLGVMNYLGYSRTLASRELVG